jgi:IQ domain-containing protein G
LTRQWEEKYENEVQQLDERISETKDIMIALKLKFDDLVDQYNTREFEVQDYLEEKKIKDDEIMETEKRYQAVVKIQSWWKGIMVRRGLGPYRRKKTKAKAGKKSKGKKK